jgi:hypothetical protein
MNIKLHEVTIRDLFKGYKDSQEEGVVAYSGLLDIRPKYQREFVYDDKKRNAVIDTVQKDFPLNVMYWAVNGDGTYEVIDGQQRTLSICQYVNGDFSIKDEDGNPMYFHTQKPDRQEQILNYKLMVYFCEGSESEKLAWFKTVNIAGERLTDQELRNAVYCGDWLTHAKRYFSKSGCAAVKVGDKYVKGQAIRQELLETALEWIAIDRGCSIEDYMSKHARDAEATELWEYYRDVIDWVRMTFPKYRKEMKDVNRDWGRLFHDFKDEHYDTALLEEEIDRLMKDDDITSSKGIYLYVLTRQERFLSLRTFDQRTRRAAYESQNGRCPLCGMTYKYDEMEADHIIPWSKGGHTTADNCQMLCRECNRTKGNK